MGLASFISSILTNKAKKVDIYEALYDDFESDLSLQAYSIQVVAGLIAILLSKCEFEVYRDKKQYKGLEWYLLNVRPNANQSANEFWLEVSKKLLVKGEVLIVQARDQLIIADSFSKEKYVLNDWIFSDVTRDNFTFNKNFLMNECLYFSYDNGRAKAQLSGLLNHYNNLLQITEKKYKFSGGQKGTLEIPAMARGDPNFEDKFKKLMNEHFKEYFKNTNAVIPLHSGMKFVPQSFGGGSGSTADTTNYSNLVTDAIAKTALAYNVAPALFKGDAAGLNDAINQTLTTAIDPVARKISQELTAKRNERDEVIEGNYIKMSTDNIKHIDIFDLASNIDKLVASSVFNVDTIRQKAGYEPTGEEWSQRYIRTKNYEEIGVIGGEGNE